MNAKPNPLLWLLTGFISCGALLTGILWWRGGGNPFVKTSPVAVAAVPLVAPPEPPVAPSALVSGAPEPAAPDSKAPDPKAVPASPPPVPAADALKTATESHGLSSLTALAALAKSGALPQPELMEAVFKWGTDHLPAGLHKEDAPFKDVLKILKDAGSAEERGVAAVALAGSGRSSEALEAIRKAEEALKPDAPEGVWIKEALKLATSVPDPARAAGKDSLKATPPAPKAIAEAPPAGDKPKKTDRAESVRRPVLPHETPEDAAKVARRLKQVTDYPEPVAPSLTSPPPPVSISPVPFSGGTQHVKIQPAN